MTEEAARARARKRMTENLQRIERQTALIAALESQGRPTVLAEDVLANLKRSHTLFTEHYVSLGGNLE